MKNKHKILIALVLLLVALGLAQAFKKSSERLIEETTQTPTQQIEESQPTPAQPGQQNITISPGNNGCYVGGCSAQLCTDNPNMVSTCEFAAVYSCYQSNITTCERQSDGHCGWTQTAALAQCLDDHPSEIQ